MKGDCDPQQWLDGVQQLEEAWCTADEALEMLRPKKKELRRLHPAAAVVLSGVHLIVTGIFIAVIGHLVYTHIWP